MAHGWPDYTYPITIIGQELNVGVDIAAQSIGNLAVDIAAQTLPTLKVDIAAQTITTLSVDIAAQSVGNLAVDIAAQTLTTLSVDIAAQSLTTLSVDIAAQTLTNLSVDIAAQSLTNLSVDIAAQSVGNIAIDIAAQSIDVAITNATDPVTGDPIPLDIDIAAQSVANLTVDIAAQSLTTLAVDISAQTLETLNVNIAAQTIDINIKTSSGTNIVIDKLTQTAVQQTEFTYENYGSVTGWTSSQIGKYFARGCLGYIRAVRAYLRNTDTIDHTVTLYLSRMPNEPSIASQSATVTAGSEGWIYFWFHQPWNYDTLFAWFEAMPTGVSVAYTEANPPDTWTWDGTQFTPTMSWETGVPKQLHLAFETLLGPVGVLPVSGTLNTIQIPNTLTDMDFWVDESVPASSDVDLLPTTYGTGRLIGFQFQFRGGSAGPTASDMFIGIEVDGQTFINNILAIQLAVGDAERTFSPISMGLNDVTNNYYQVSFNFPISFRRSIRIFARNTNTTSSFLVEGFYALEMIR